MNDLRWYALLTKARHEKTVRDQLSGHGIEQFLPTINRINQWKDRKARVEAPLFTSYCFARFPWQNKFAVLNVPGVLHIVGSGNRPEAIPEAEIDAVRVMTASTLPFQVHPYLHEGTRVEVIRGPLRGVTGILLAHRRTCRLVLSINLLQLAASVEIDADDVVPIEQSTGSASYFCPAAV